MLTRADERPVSNFKTVAQSLSRGRGWFPFLICLCSDLWAFIFSAFKSKARKKGSHIVELTPILTLVASQ